VCVVLLLEAGVHEFLGKNQIFINLLKRENKITNNNQLTWRI